MRAILIFCLTVFASACAYQPVPSDMSGEQLVESETSLSTGVAAADLLLQQGEQARMKGDYQTAASNLERGLRLAPRSAALYLALAKTRLAMGDGHRAKQMAKKALSLLPAEPRGEERRVQAEARFVIERAAGV